MSTHTWADKRPIETGETFITFTDPLILAPGHPLRGERCVLCAELVGGRPVSFIQTIVADEAACVCGQIPGTSRLICGHHGDPIAEQVVKASMLALLTAHPRGGHKP